VQSAGQLVRLEPRTLAVVVATTGRLRADVAGNRTFLTGFIKDFAAC
jgi:hypothetical protein